MAAAPSAQARVEAATSPALLEADWALNFEVVDALGDAGTARDTVRALRARLAHQNPKVLLLALTVRAGCGLDRGRGGGGGACAHALARRDRERPIIAFARPPDRPPTRARTALSLSSRSSTALPLLSSSLSTSRSHRPSRTSLLPPSPLPHPRCTAL
jgi:hypothetical protein